MRRDWTTWLVGVATLLACSTAVAEPEAGRRSTVGRGGGAPAEAVYDPTGRRDPFRPPRVNQTNLLGEARTPLQRYDLGQLRLVAVI